MNQEPVRLLLIRHGEAPSNRQLRYLGDRDEGLTHRGEWQVECLGRELAGMTLGGIYSSPLRRTRLTAEAISQHGGPHVTVEERLREQSYGEWEGLSFQEIEAQTRAEGEPPGHWISDPELTPPGGESLASVQNRVLEAVREITERHRGENVALVSHVGPIKCLLCEALGLSMAGGLRLFLDPATITVVDWGRPPMLRLFNSHAHLGWGEARWMASASPKT
jgi:broad specificity phosphatase PhoE